MLIILFENKYSGLHLTFNVDFSFKTFRLSKKFGIYSGNAHRWLLQSQIRYATDVVVFLDGVDRGLNLNSSSGIFSSHRIPSYFTVCFV